MSDPQQPAQSPHVPPHAQQAPQARPAPHPGYPSPQQQAYPQPNAAPGYVLNGQPSHPGQAAPGVGNPAGKAGLILGLVAIAISVIQTILLQVLIRSGSFDNYALYSVVTGLGTLLAFVAALAALILGLIGIRRVGAPHAAAGIALGIGIAQVVGIGIGFFVNVLGSFLYF